MPKQTKKKVGSIPPLLSAATITTCLLTNLPDELLLSIFKHVEMEARPNLVRSCPRFYLLKDSIYKEQVKTRSGQQIYLDNCPRCKKIMSLPLASPIAKKRIPRPFHRGKSYCSYACTSAQQLLELGKKNK